MVGGKREQLGLNISLIYGMAWIAFVSVTTIFWKCEMTYKKIQKNVCNIRQHWKSIAIITE